MSLGLLLAWGNEGEIVAKMKTTRHGSDCEDLKKPRLGQSALRQGGHRPGRYY